VWAERGSGEGQLNSPSNVAVGPDGSVYVADAGNSRIQKFTADGEFVTAWGHWCNMETGEGCQSPDGAGGFYDPWGNALGVAVDGDGFVYVSDVWNHRVQKFTSDGQFVTMWGQYGVAEVAGGAPGQFWGPRDVAVGPGGLIYVSDTGNKRIQVFTADGQYVTEWGGKGITDGRFEEPVGLALAPDGTIYVADTWNQRIQAFGPAGEGGGYVSLRQWELDSWYGQSIQNKPYLAVDLQGRVYATDPEASRVLIFDASGAFLATLGPSDSSGYGFSLPTGIAVDQMGYIYVADPTANRVLKLAPFGQ